MAVETRRAILEVAHELFVERGWKATNMRDIAAGAGVAVETVYSNFKSKVALLAAVADMAVVGDDDPVPLADRPEFRALGEGELADRTTTLGLFLAALHARTARLHRVLQHAASGDAELTALVAESYRTERISVREGITAFAGRPATDLEADSLFAVLSDDVYLLLTEVTGWTPQQYAAWVGATTVRLLDLKVEEQ
jgi:AcrR family transcriptional regulator